MMMPQHTGQHDTHTQPYEQLLTGWIVGAVSISNASNSHPSEPTSKRSSCEHDDEQ